MHFGKFLASPGRPGLRVVFAVVLIEELRPAEFVLALRENDV